VDELVDEFAVALFVSPPLAWFTGHDVLPFVQALPLKRDDGGQTTAN